MISILKSMPRSGKYPPICFNNLLTESSLQVFNRVEIASDATDLLESVTKLSSSA